MNKKGQALLLKFMLGIIAFIVIMIMVSPVKEAIDINTNSSLLNCSASGLSVETEATCIVTDFLLFYMIGIGISVSMAYIAGKKNVNGTVTAIVLFVLTTILIEPLKTIIILARDSGHLNCGAVGNSVGVQLSCMVVDLWLFWLIATVLSAAVTFIFVKTTSKGEL